MNISVAGAWNRQWEEDPLGDSVGADRETFVLWIQSQKSGVYVDLRLPAGSPGRSDVDARNSGFAPRPQAIAGKAFGDASRDIILASADPKNTTKKENLMGIILRQKSFAGVLDCKSGDTTKTGAALKKDTVLATLASGNDDCGSSNSPRAISLCTCFWRRDLDYQPPSGGLDVGVCASEAPNDDGSVLMRETGDDASYAEGWLRPADTVRGPFMALELFSENGIEGARAGYWVRAGMQFAYAVGRPTSVDAEKRLDCVDGSSQIKECVGKSLLDAVQTVAAGVNKKILDLVASYVAVAGTVSCSDTNWSISRSTNPELVGCLLLGDEDNKPCCSHILMGKSDKCAVGDVVEQILHAAVGESSIVRLWKVVELTGCNLPVNGNRAAVTS